jgi:hypothetical protein
MISEIYNEGDFKPTTITIKVGCKRIILKGYDGKVVYIEEPKNVEIKITKECHPGDLHGNQYISAGSVNFKTVKKITLKMKEE